MLRKKKCIFLDRDGTLIETPNNRFRKPKSFNNLNQVHLKTEVIDVCKKLKNIQFLYRVMRILSLRTTKIY